MNSKLCISSSHRPWHGFHESVTKRVAPPRPRVHLIKKVSHPKESIDEFISTLPHRKGWSQPLVQYKNFWFRGPPLEQILRAEDAFEPRADDIILATQPKCGMTWLKALAFTIVNRSCYIFDDHPLLTSHPQRVVPFIEIPSVVGGTDHHAHIETLSSPRLLATHIPMSLLPLDMSARVVYVCRDPKDALVSRLFFENRITQGSDLSMDSAFSMFCEGFSSYGPFWDHCLEYWKESLARPNNVLFLKYEEIKSDPVQVVRRLAKFLGVPLSQEEERSGVAQEVVRLCSFEMLTSLKVNQVGGIDRGNKCYVGNSMFFRKGKVGDWSNHMSQEMGEKLDCIVREKLRATFPASLLLILVQRSIIFISPLSTKASGSERICCSAWFDRSDTMASGAGSCWALVALLLVARAFPAGATSFTVGGKSGWTIGVDYTTWASGNTFKVGDSLVFNYAKGLHTVAEVSAADYLACAAANALGSDSSGATTVPLKTAGKHYFICTITGHCAGGMKLEVTVSGSGSGSGSSSPTTPMPTPTTPYTSPTPTTPYTSPTPTTPYTSPTPTTPYTTPTTPYTTPTSPACTGTTPGATPLTPVTPGTMPFYSYNGAAGLAPVAWASFALVCAAVAQLGLF